MILKKQIAQQNHLSVDHLKDRLDQLIHYVQDISPEDTTTPPTLKEYALHAILKEQKITRLDHFLTKIPTELRELNIIGYCIPDHYARSLNKYMAELRSLLGYPFKLPEASSLMNHQLTWVKLTDRFSDALTIAKSPKERLKIIEHIQSLIKKDTHFPSFSKTDSLITLCSKLNINAIGRETIGIIIQKAIAKKKKKWISNNISQIIQILNRNLPQKIKSNEIKLIDRAIKILALNRHLSDDDLKNLDPLFTYYENSPNSYSISQTKKLLMVKNQTKQSLEKQCLECLMTNSLFNSINNE